MMRRQRDDVQNLKALDIWDEGIIATVGLMHTGATTVHKQTWPF